jgi:hypothetical protein
MGCGGLRTPALLKSVPLFAAYQIDGASGRLPTPTLALSAPVVPPAPPAVPQCLEQADSDRCGT